jgi:hypothetical protein
VLDGAVLAVLLGVVVLVGAAVTDKGVDPGDPLRAGLTIGSEPSSGSIGRQFVLLPSVMSGVSPLPKTADSPLPGAPSAARAELASWFGSGAGSAWPCSCSNASPPAQANEKANTTPPTARNLLRMGLLQGF